MEAALGQDCLLCAAPSADLVCTRCEEDLPRADPSLGAVCLYRYGFPVDRLVQRFKFSGDLATGHWLAERLAVRVAGEARPSLLVAPPLTASRLRERGFNQSLELARVVGRRLRVPRAVTGLQKVRETVPQQGLGREARRRNLRGAFQCDLDLQGEHVAIVDDVLTTGATASAIAAALRGAGAASVALWAVARAAAPR